MAAAVLDNFSAKAALEAPAGQAAQELLGVEEEECLEGAEG